MLRRRWLQVQEPRLVIPKVAANETGVTKMMISYLARRGYVERYYVLGNLYNYMVDLNEVIEQLELGQERKQKTQFSPKN